MDSERPLKNVLTCLGLNIKYWTSPDLNSLRWLGLFTNKTFRKHRKLIFPHRDFIICIVSLAIFHPHFVICILSSASFHRHFSIGILSSAIFHMHFIIRIFLSAIHRHPVRTLQRPHGGRCKLNIQQSTVQKYCYGNFKFAKKKNNQMKETRQEVQ